MGQHRGQDLLVLIVRHPSLDLPLQPGRGLAAHRVWLISDQFVLAKSVLDADQLVVTN